MIFFVIILSFLLNQIRLSLSLLWRLVYLLLPYMVPPSPCPSFIQVPLHSLLPVSRRYDFPQIRLWCSLAAILELAVQLFLVSRCCQSLFLSSLLSFSYSILCLPIATTSFFFFNVSSIFFFLLSSSSSPLSLFLPFFSIIFLPFFSSFFSPPLSFFPCASLCPLLGSSCRGCRRREGRREEGRGPRIRKEGGEAGREDGRAAGIKQGLAGL